MDWGGGGEEWELGGRRLGGEARRQERWAEAEKMYLGALDLTPDSKEVLTNLGIALKEQGQGKSKDSIKYLERLIVVEPNNAEVRIKLGNVFSSLGRHKEAAQSMEAAIAIDPSQSKAYMNLGNERFRLKLWEDALEAYRGGVKVNPAYTKCRVGLVHTLTMLKRYDEAITEYEEAISRDPSNIEAKDRMAKILKIVPGWSKPK